MSKYIVRPYKESEWDRRGASIIGAPDFDLIVVNDVVWSYIEGNAAI